MTERKGSGTVRARPFSFHDGERVLRFGALVEEDAPGLLADAGFGEDRVLLTTERAEPEVPDELRAAAHAVLHVAAGPVAPAAAGLLDDVGGRDVVAYGGGRVVDAAKAVAAVGGGRVAAIPTTLAGSSYTPFHRLPDGQSGFATIRPALAICEPARMTGAPRALLTATAMNALAHAVESLYAPYANPVAEGGALRAAPLILRALEADALVAADLALGALLGGYAVGVTAGLLVHHATCQTIVAVCGTPHAQTNAVVLAHSIRFMADRAPGPLERLAAALGEPSPRAAADRIAATAAASGAATLADLGVDTTRIDEVVGALTRHPGVAATPGAPTRDDLRRLLESAHPG